MGVFPPRTLETEAAKHFAGTPAERFHEALRLGRKALRLFLAAQPPGTSEIEAREILRRRKHAGRRRSRVLDPDPE
jgi:hypothetical protein